jgi:transposase
MTIRVRALGDGEAERLAHMTRPRALGAGLVRRAQIVRQVADGLSAPAIAAKMDLCGATVRFWLKRFNARGLAGLEEDMRSGRPPTHSSEERSAAITAALSRPSDLGLPFASWTLDRLVAHLGEQGIGMRRSRISEVLLAEGLKWRQEETWFGARVDPEFTRKRSHGHRTAGLVKSGGPHPLPTRETAHAQLLRSRCEPHERRHDLPGP